MEIKEGSQEPSSIRKKDSLTLLCKSQQLRKAHLFTLKGMHFLFSRNQVKSTEDSQAEQPWEVKRSPVLTLSLLSGPVSTATLLWCPHLRLPYHMHMCTRTLAVPSRLWPAWFGNACLPVEMPRIGSSSVCKAGCLSSPNLSAVPEDSWEVLVFSLSWNSKEVGSGTVKWMPQQQDRQTCQWEWGKSSKK